MPATEIDQCEDNAKLREVAKHLTAAVNNIATDISDIYSASTLCDVCYCDRRYLLVTLPCKLHQICYVCAHSMINASMTTVKTNNKRHVSQTDVSMPTFVALIVQIAEHSTLLTFPHFAVYSMC